MQLYQHIHSEYVLSILYTLNHYINGPLYIIRWVYGYLVVAVHVHCSVPFRFVSFHSTHTQTLYLHLCLCFFFHSLLFLSPFGLTLGFGFRFEFDALVSVCRLFARFCTKWRWWRRRIARAFQTQTRDVNQIVQKERRKRSEEIFEG